MQKIAIIGLGTFGQHLAKALAASGAEVLGIDADAANVDAMRDEVTVAVRLDATDPAALRSQGVDEMDAAVVGIGEDFEAAALTVAALKELEVPQIVARARTEIQSRILTKIGAHAIALAEKESAYRWAHRLTLPNLEQYVELGEGYSMVYIPAPTEFHQRTLLELGLRKNYGVNLVAIRRDASGHGADDTESGPADDTEKSEAIFVPRPDSTIMPGDVLIVVGSDEALSELPND